MYISNNETQNYPFCRLKLVVVPFEHSINKPTNQYSVKVPKTWETCVLNSPLSPLSLTYKAISNIYTRLRHNTTKFSLFIQFKYAFYEKYVEAER